MKRTFLDRLVGFVSPEAEIRRVKARGKLEFLQRSYDAAATFKTDDWTSVTKASANKEIEIAQPILRDKARDAVRNNPYAVHARDVIVSNTVGYGIVPNIKGTSPAQTEEVRQAWKLWGETNLCDAEGIRDFYGLQAQIMGATVEAGEAIGNKVLTKAPMPIVSIPLKKTFSGLIQIQILESDFIDSKKKDAKTTQGVERDGFGRRIAYWLFSTHPGESESASKKYPAENIAHVFKADRPMQVRGVSWFHSVIRLLEDLKNFQEATLIRQKIAACFAAFVTPDSSDSLLDPEALRARREQDSALEPGLIRYLNQGETIAFANPPGVENYAEYCRQNLRGASAGLGITYESLTNDYSQVNFSSGRMGHLEMKRNIDMWRWNMLIPQFCEPAFKWFLEWCQQNAINVEGVTVEWTPPAREMIDPGTEIEAIKKAIRTGIKTLPEAIREQGHDPETFFLEVKTTNDLMDSLKLAFDSDPRKMSNVGFAQAGDSFDKLQGLTPLGDTSSEENSEEVPSGGDAEEPS